MGEFYRSTLPTIRCRRWEVGVALSCWLGVSTLMAQNPDTGRKPSPSPVEEPSSAGGYEAFIEENAIWLIVGILVAILTVGLWALRGSGRRAKGAVAPVRSPESGEGKRYSSTRIQVAEVNDRLGAKVEATEIETEVEYALVVDEEALHIPETVDTRTGTAYVEDSLIAKLLNDKRFDDAYLEYTQRLKEDGSLEFHRGVEERLGNHFLATRDLEKAASVFEHYVATHPADDVRPEVYFNLGYIHFLRQSANKSKRFLKLFLAASDNPTHARRAERILAQLGDSGS
jgi:hypothetical protein